MTAARGFGDTLCARVADRQSQIVLGVDPDPDALWPYPIGRHTTSRGAPPRGAQAGRKVAAAAAASPEQALAEHVRTHCLALIEAAAPACVAVKLQLARFEVLAARGRELLGELAGVAREQGLLVIADGKRGDIDVSAAAYAAALYDGVQTPRGRVAGLGSDAATVNPLMGTDAIEPFVEAARRGGAGVLVLVRTSNPGAREVQDLELAGGGTVWERLAGIVARLGATGVGAGGLSDIGAVMGASDPQHLGRARELMPRAPFLLPGVGAQGGLVADLGAAFAPGRAGGLISASRSVANAWRERGGDPKEAARAAAEALREQAWELSEGR